MPIMTTSFRESSTHYQAADGSELPLLVFEPGDGVQVRAGIVLFHGGALLKGSADRLAPHCRSLAARGILAVSAGYRLVGLGARSIDDCLADARLAIEEFGRLARSRGLGATQLASGGSSAGGHLALLAALIGPDGHGRGDGHAHGAGPTSGPGVAAVVGFNPAGLDLRSFAPELRRQLEEQIGIAAGRLAEYSAIEFVRPGNPPVLIHHGTDDEVEPIDCVRRFRDAMVRAGNECTLLEYENGVHGFHYPGDDGHFDEVIDVTARFLLDRVAMA